MSNNSTVEDSIKSDLNNAAAWQALATLLIEKGIIALDEFEYLKNKYFDEMIDQLEK